MSNEWEYSNYELNNEILLFCNVVIAVCGGSICPEKLNKRKQNKWKQERKQILWKFKRYGIGLDSIMTDVEIQEYENKKAPKN